ncbi:MAG: signal peptide peptidase SppA [Candidatus Aureabacteria bacterium]|nr:signal peptide peptidase SppA [Candidatus Auribacterota bacterium]
MDQEKKCSHAVFWITIILLVIVLLGSLLMNLGFFVSLIARSGKIYAEKGEDEFPRLTEVWSYGEGTVKAARISVEGALIRGMDPGMFSIKRDKIEKILRQIRAARNDESVKAIILEVDSPGGEITPSDEIFTELMDFKNSNQGRKVVVFMKGIAASGGYYIAMAGDYILAEPTTLTGSIGVIIQSLNWKSLSEKIGVKDTTIKSGKNKDLLNPFQDPSQEQIDMLKDVVLKLHGRFIDIVCDSRNIEKSKMDVLADGRVFSASQALEHGLIDEIGYFRDAARKAKELCQVENLKIIRYEQKTGLMEALFEASQSLNLRTFLEGDSPRILYLWKP